MWPAIKRFEMPRRSLAPATGDVARPAHPAGRDGPGGPRTNSERERDLAVASAKPDKPKNDVNAVDDAQRVRAADSAGARGDDPRAPACGFSERATGCSQRGQAGMAWLIGPTEGGKSSPQASTGEEGALTCEPSRAQSPGSTMSQASEPDDPPSDADVADGDDQVRESPEGQEEEAGRGRSRGRDVDLNGEIGAPGERGEDEQPAAPLAVLGSLPG